MAAVTRHFELSLLPERLAISRLSADSPIPAWAMQGSFFSVTRTGDELSIVTELSRVPAGVKSQSGWHVLKVHGPFVLSEIGVLAALAAPLAEAKISLFAISTFDTDYLLVASESCQQPSPRWSGQDTPFMGAKRNDQGIPSHGQSPS